MHRSTLAAAVGVVAISAIALTGCSSGSSSTSSSSSNDSRGPITFVTGKQSNGFIPSQLATWNKEHPDEKVTLIELPTGDSQRQQMVQNFTTQSDQYSVVNIDAIWTAEFAANQWIDELDPEEFDLSADLPSTVETGKYNGKQYSIPVTSDGQMLYYRSDLLQQAGISAPPKTWSEMVDDCSAVRKIVPTIDCFGGQYDKYEGLTVNVATAIQSAGGSLVDSSGKVTVDTPEALAGLRFLTDGFTNGTIPAAAITWQEENGRQDFQDGNLLFMNNWAYVYALANATDGSSKVNGKFAISPIPGKDGLGTGTLGGHNYAVSAFAKNKATARDFIKFMAGESQQTNALINAASPPTIASLYDDPELVAKAPYLPVLKESIEHSVKRPEAVNYNEASSAIQKAVYPALQGKTSPEDALKTLQKTLTAALKN